MDSLTAAGMLSHQLKQHVIDGEKTIIQNPTDQQKWASPLGPLLPAAFGRGVTGCRAVTLFLAAVSCGGCGR